MQIGEPASPSPPKDPSATWLSIRLLDAEGEPVANAEYEVVVHGGDTIRGKLDANGQARLSGLKAGSYSVKFPALEQRRWNPSGNSRGAGRRA